MNLCSLFTKERELKMIWKLEKDGKVSFLAGTAHFFPFSFKKSLRIYIRSVNTVLIEGPLDEKSMSRVLDSGLEKENVSNLYEALDSETIKQINKVFAHPRKGLSSFASYGDTFKPKTKDFLCSLSTLKPWMAFFFIWLNYLEKRGWRYKMDVDALTIAQQLGKDIHFLEQIEEQLEALDSIPFERITHFLKKIEDWGTYAKAYVKCYLKGDLDALMSIASGFPSRCTTVIDKRDPILYERMQTFFEKGNTIAFVGAPHVKEIKKMLLRDGYEVAQLS